MATRRAGSVEVFLHSIFATRFEDERSDLYRELEPRIGKTVAALNRKYKVGIGRAFVDPVVRTKASDLRPGFSYTIERGRKGLDVEVMVSLAQWRAVRMSRAAFAEDLFEASMFLIERVCWQRGLGTYRERHPRWERSLRSGTAFPELTDHPRGQVYWEWMGKRPGEWDCFVECPGIGAEEWDGLVDEIAAVIGRMRGLRVDHIGHDAKKKHGEVIIAGPKLTLQKGPKALRPVFEGRAGAMARMKASMSEAKGKVVRMG